MATRSFIVPDLFDDKGRVPVNARVWAYRTDTHAYVEEAILDANGNATFSSLPTDTDIVFHATWGGITGTQKEKWFFSHIPGIAEGGTGASTAAGAASALGVGTEDSPHFTEVNIGHATDTTIARTAAGRVTIEGKGGVRGPASATDNRVATYDGTTGDLVQESNSVLIDDSDNISGVATLSTSGNIGVGITYNADYGIYIARTFTDTDDSAKIGIYSLPQVAKTSAAMTGAGFGVYGRLYLDSTNTQNWTSSVGLRGIWGEVSTEAGSTGTITGAANLVSYANIADAATITNLYGLHILTPGVAGSKVTNLYGIYIADQSGGATLNYSIYTGVGAVRFGGNIELGHDTDTTIARAAAGRAAIEGVGLVRGPSSAVDNAIARFNGTTGDLIQDYTSNAPTISDTGDVTIDGDIDFAEYKAIAMVCDNGATAPAAPTKGQWFLHTPTGRTVLMQYDGSNWIGIISLGTFVVYVDKTDGSDAIDEGTAVDGSAFATVQYAVDRIPGLVGGNVTININDEDYAESVTINGKSLTGNYTITLQGALALQETESGATVADGDGAVAGTIAGTLDADYSDKLAYLNTDGVYRLIDSNTFTLGYDSGSVAPVAGDIINDNTSGAHATVVAVNHASGTWAGGDDAGTFTLHVTLGTFGDDNTLNNETQSETNFATVDTAAGNAANNNIVILCGTAGSSTGQDVLFYDWDTTINKIVVAEGQQGVELHDLYFDTTIALKVAGYSKAELYRCKLAVSGASALKNEMSNVECYQCYLSSGGIFDVDVSQGAWLYLWGCKVYSTTSSDKAIRAFDVAILTFRGGTVIDASTITSTIGIYCQRNSASDAYATAGEGYPRIRNQAYGIYALQGGQALNTANIQYSGNSTDELASAGTFGYVD